MAKLLPKYYENSRIFKEHLATNKKAKLKLVEQINHDRKRFYATETEELTDAELDVGILPDTAIPDDFRRARIIARLRAMPYATKQKLIEIALPFWSKGVEITEDNPNYKIFIDFLGGQPSQDDLAIIRNEIAEIIPAHLWFGAKSRLSPSEMLFTASPIQRHIIFRMEAPA